MAGIQILKKITPEEKEILDNKEEFLHNNVLHEKEIDQSTWKTTIELTLFILMYFFLPLTAPTRHLFNNILQPPGWEFRHFYKVFNTDRCQLSVALVLNTISCNVNHTRAIPNTLGMPEKADVYTITLETILISAIYFGSINQLQLIDLKAFLHCNYSAILSFNHNKTTKLTVKIRHLFLYLIGTNDFFYNSSAHL